MHKIVQYPIRDDTAQAVTTSLKLIPLQTLAGGSQGTGWRTSPDRPSFRIFMVRRIPQSGLDRSQCRGASLSLIPLQTGQGALGARHGQARGPSQGLSEWLSQTQPQSSH
jgi:hypothetical protein